MAKMTRTEKELMKAAGLDEYKSEDRKAQLKELCLAIQKNVDDDSFEDLSEPAQAWANAATAAVEKKKPIADFGSAPKVEEPEEAPGADEDDEMAEEPEVEEANEKPAKKPTKLVEKKSVAKKGAAGGRGVKGDGYKGHRVGSCKEKAHELFDKHGADKAWPLVLKLKTNKGTPPSESTVRNWFSTWG